MKGTTNIIIREAGRDDIPELVGLMDQLGYPTSEEEMIVRFEAIGRHPDYACFVASCNETVAGMIGLIRSYAFERNGVYVRVGALVVHESYRKHGIGKLLMKKAEDWAQQQGAGMIVLTSRNIEERLAAHALYKKMGYKKASSGFKKMLD
ncbi:MAG TPA: GNAT family N-acetyltransferase [Puia sp.]|nr:GNAT family N-acetyltransferase [Puia sp.]